MYKSPQDSYIKTELVHVATEFKKSKFKDIDAIKGHLQTLNDEENQVITDQIIGIQHQKVCCGYLQEIRVKMCSEDHQLVYVVIQKEIGQKMKCDHIKWIKKLSQ